MCYALTWPSLALAKHAKYLKQYFQFNKPRINEREELSLSLSLFRNVQTWHVTCVFVCVCLLICIVCWAGQFLSICVLPCTSSNDSRFQDMPSRICTLCCAVLKSIRLALCQLLPLQKWEKLNYFAYLAISHEACFKLNLLRWTDKPHSVEQHYAASLNLIQVKLSYYPKRITKYMYIL